MDENIKCLQVVGMILLGICVVFGTLCPTTVYQILKKIFGYGDKTCPECDGKSVQDTTAGYWCNTCKQNGRLTHEQYKDCLTKKI